MISYTKHRWSGFLQLTFGGTLVSLLVLAALLSSVYAERLQQQRSSPYDIEYAAQPPAMSLLNRLLNPRGDILHDGGEPAQELSLQPETIPNRVDTESIHPFGTDEKGQDILGNIMAGARVVLFGGLYAIFVALLLGLPLGVLTGYYGGKIGHIAGTIASTLTTLPRLIVLIITVATLGFDPLVIMTTIGILLSTKLIDVIRGRIELLQQNAFIESSRELGLPDRTIIFKHILWYNCRVPLLIQLVHDFSEVILLEASLGYIGWGIRTEVSWGKMAAGGMAYLSNEYYWMLFFPAAAIVLAITGFTLLAEGIGKRQRQAGY